MKIIKEDGQNTDCLEFDGGARIYANCGMIGIGETDEGGVNIGEGWDGSVSVMDEKGSSHDLSISQKSELADYAIGLWEIFKRSG